MATVQQPPAPSPPATLPESPLDDVLRAVNVIRTAHGADPLYELPQGHRAFDPGACVLEEAFGDLGVLYVDYRHAVGKHIRIEHGLGSFIRRFDAGQYPELVRPV